MTASLPTRPFPVRSRLSLAGASLLLTLLAACSFTTAHLSSFKLGKDKEVTSETSKFGPKDEVWAKTEVANVPSKVTLKFSLVLVKVAGQPEGLHNPGTDYSVDLEASGTGTYHLTPPPTGWPSGTYRVEVAMVTNTGEQKDQKTAEFTVSGS